MASLRDVVIALSPAQLELLHQLHQHGGSIRFTTEKGSAAFGGAAFGGATFGGAGETEEVEEEEKTKGKYQFCDVEMTEGSLQKLLMNLRKGSDATFTVPAPGKKECCMVSLPLTTQQKNKISKNKSHGKGTRVSLSKPQILALVSANDGKQGGFPDMVEHLDEIKETLKKKNS